MKPWEFRGRKTERNAPTVPFCTPSSCKGHRPSPSQAHCRMCCETFGGISGFDLHRQNGWCLDPASVGLSADDRGIWRWPASERMGRFIEEVTGAQPLPGL